MTAHGFAAHVAARAGWARSVPWAGFSAAGAGGLALDLVGAALSAENPRDAGSRFFEALRPYGIRTLHARAFVPAPGGTWVEHCYCGIAPAGWDAARTGPHLAEAAPMLRELQRRAAPFTWSDVALLTPGERGLARIATEDGVADGLAVPCHGPCGYAGVVSMGFADLDGINPSERRVIAAAALALHARMRALSDAAAPLPPRLTRRERDCLLWIADGKSDREIAELLGLGVPTVVTHIKTARTKLGAKTRAQAVAHFLTMCAY